jgi:hypothetical protein
MDRLNASARLDSVLSRLGWTMLGETRELFEQAFRDAETQGFAEANGDPVTLYGHGSPPTTAERPVADDGELGRLWARIAAVQAEMTTGHAVLFAQIAEIRRMLGPMQVGQPKAFENHPGDSITASAGARPDLMQQDGTRETPPGLPVE